MNKLKTEKKRAVISALVEGCSVRSTERMTGVIGIRSCGLWFALETVVDG